MSVKNYILLFFSDLRECLAAQREPTGDSPVSNEQENEEDEGFVDLRNVVSELLGLAEGLQINAELLAFFVEVAALESQRAGDVGHVKVVALDFREQHFLFEGFGALGKCPLPCRSSNCRRRAASSFAREHKAHVRSGDGIFRGQQH